MTPAPAKTNHARDRATPPRPSRVIAGIDEAGLGPLLGPLSIGWSVFRLPEPGADPWVLLRGKVNKNPTRTAKLVVADSKRVYSRNARGLRRLETTVLTFLSMLDEHGRPPRDPRAFLFGELGPSEEEIRAHPWYSTLPTLPRVLDAASVELSSAVLARRMSERGLSLLDAGTRVVPAGALNASFEETGNKGTTIWANCLAVLQRLWQRHGESAPDVTVDILGGRIRYASLLREGFPGADVRVLFEGPEHSAYQLDERDETGAERWLPRRMRIDFLAKGEDASFAVALGSCIAKYARELAMSGFNAYFEERQADLVPTAGYTTDGRRWLDDAHEAIRAAGVPDDVLIRTR